MALLVVTSNPLWTVGSLQVRGEVSTMLWWTPRRKCLLPNMAQNLITTRIRARILLGLTRHGMGLGGFAELRNALGT